MKSLLIGTVVILGISTGAALAQQQGGVVVGGDVEQKVRTGDVTNAVSGQDASGEVNVGSISGNVTVAGDVKQDVETGNVTNVVNGKNACGNTNVGSVTSASCN